MSILLPFLKLRVSSRGFSRTSIKCYDQDWRKKKGFPENPNKLPVFLDSPDYTFVDGRPAPYSIGQKRRMVKQREYTETIIKLTKEVDFAVDNHKKLQEAKQIEESNILKAKLKEKGKKQIS